MPLLRFFVSHARLYSVSNVYNFNSYSYRAIQLTSFCAKLRVDDMSPPATTAQDVALVWKMSKHAKRLHAEVILQETSENADDKYAVTASASHATGTTSKISDGTPTSVLLYERQLRKAQHSKKVGLALSSHDVQVVYVDKHLVVVNKPPGMLTVPGVNCNPSLLDLVHEQYGKGIRDPATMIVHRLDMDTSGLVLFARTAQINKKLNAMFRDREVSKEYECLVMGHMLLHDSESKEHISLTIDLPLQRDHAHPPFMRVSTPQSEQAAIAAIKDLQTHGWKKLVRKRPKPSQTAVTVMEHGTRSDMLPYTRLRLEPITGRTHQLRVHWFVYLQTDEMFFDALFTHPLSPFSAALGFPIIGDPTYSLFGEAAPVGGLQDVPSYRIDSDTKSFLMARKSSSAALGPTCPIEVQRAWTAEHPPNDKPMYLHAALLTMVHPATGEIIKWESVASF